jgi:hypothetical protein
MYIIIIVLFASSSIVESQCPNGYRPSAVISNKCYNVHTVKANCFNANDYCQNILNGANLVSIYSAYENNDIYGQIYLS